MEKKNTILYISFLIAVLCLLTVINFFKNSTYVSMLGSFSVLIISILLIVIVTLISIYREVENNRILNQFFTIVAHKIKAPLTGIRWSIDVLQKNLTLTEKQELLEEMRKADSRLMEILDLLVGFAKFDKQTNYVFESVSLREIVGESINKNSSLAKNKKIDLTIISNRELLPILGDKMKIQFAIDMLLDNALKYTPIGGSITISFESDTDSVTVKIKDTGIGLSFMDSKRIFKRFFRSSGARKVDSGGLGLGLYTVKKIISHHGGRIWAESEGLNKGSTFCIELPIKK